jgi:hypothetical protein
MHLVALLPAVALSSVLGGQTGGTGGVIRATVSPTAAPHRDIPAVAARALIAAHHADVVDGSVDPAIVTLVLDAGNNYVASAVSKPAVVVQGANGSFAAAGGFVVATPTVAPSGTGGTGGTAGDGATPRATMTIAGIGPIDPTAVEEMFWTTYPAGEIAPVAVRVHFVILKAK